MRKEKNSLSSRFSKVFVTFQTQIYKLHNTVIVSVLANKAFNFFNFVSMTNGLLYYF